VPSVEAEPEPLPEPDAEPAVPTELLDVPSPADVPPVPSVEAEPEPLPEPDAEPAVPTELLDVPSPAEDPPVPNVDAEPPSQPAVPDVQFVPAEEPPVPTVLLEVPPPALVPPDPTVLLDWALTDNAEPARRAAAKAALFRILIIISFVLIASAESLMKLANQPQPPPSVPVWDHCCRDQDLRPNGNGLWSEPRNFRNLAASFFARCRERAAGRRGS